MKEELRGIRLSDIYGYNDDSYNTFVNNNIDNITSLYNVNNGKTSRDDISANLYLNSLIRDKVGDEGYDTNARGKKFSEKLAYYNSLFETEDNQLPTLDDEDISGYNLYSNFLNGEINPSSKESPEQTTMRDYFRNRIGNSQNKDVEPDSTFGAEAFERLYNPFYTRRENYEFEGTQIEKDLAAYQNEIRNKLDSDSEFTYKMFSQFENAMIKNSPYYRNYHDSYMMTLTPNDMKDIMAGYYAVNAMKGSEEALKYATEQFQNNVASNQGIWDKFVNGFYAGAGNLFGSLVSAGGIILNTGNAVYNASRKATDMPDANWFQEFLYYAADNKITKYGLDCMTTGVWNPELQQQYKENGYNPYANIRKYGEESDFWNINTLFDLGPQTMFTVAGMVQGNIANFALKNTVGAASSTVGRKLMTEGATKFARTMGQGIDALGKGIVVAGTALLPAASEAAMDAFQTYEDIMSNEFEGINIALQQVLRDSIDTEEFQDFYNARKRFALPSQEIEMSDDERKFLIERSNAENEQIYTEFLEKKKEEILNDPKFSETVHKIALASAAKNMSDETLYIAFGDLLFTNVLGGSFKLAKKQAKSALGLSSKSGFNLFRNADDALRVGDAANKWWYITKGVAKGGIESVEEGLEEGFQTVDTEMRKDLASNYIEQYILNRHDPDALDDLDISIHNNLDIVKQSLGENLLSDEAMFSFAMGAVSSGLGSPTIINGIRSSASAITSGQKRNFWKDILWDYVRNPIAENIKDQLSERAEKQAEIENINRWLEDNEEVAKIKDFNSLFAWANKQQDATLYDSEADYRDAKMGQEFATLIMMDRISGSAKEKAFSARLKEMSRLSEQSAEAQSLIDEAAAIQGVTNATDEQRHEIFQDIVNKAKRMYDLQNEIHRTRKYVESNFGEVLGPDSIDAFTYEMIMHRDISQRVKDINQSVKDAWNTSDRIEDWGAASSTSELENAMARRGSVASAKSELQRLNEQLRSLKKNKRNLIRTLGNSTYGRYIQDVKDNIKSIKDDIKLMSDNESDVVLTAEKIASLNSDARAAIIDSKNRDKYTKEQQEQIDRFLSNPNINEDIVQSIKDAASLERRYKSFSKQLKFLQSNVNNLTLYDNEIRRKAAKNLATKGLQDALNADNYEDFKIAVDEFVNSPTNTALLPVIQDVLHGNKFFDQYTKEIHDRESSVSLMSRNPIYNKLSDKQKRLFTQAYYRAISDDDTSFDNVLKYMSDNSLANSLGIDNEFINDEIFLDNIKSILSQIENHNKVVRDLNKIREDVGSSDGKSADNPDPTPKDERDSTTLNKDIYTRHKEDIDRIISNLVNFFNGRMTKSHLSFDSFCTLMQLFGDEEFTNDFLADNLSGQLNERSLRALRDTLRTTLDNYMFNNPDAADSVPFKNTVILHDNINTLLELFETSKEMGGSKDIKIFIKNLIGELSPSWFNAFNEAKKKQKPLQKLGTFRVLSEKGVNTEAEKQWFKLNGIQNNLVTLAKLNRDRTNSEPAKTVFIYDEDLANSIKEETGAEVFTSDNLPLVVAALVDKDVDGAELIDGQYVLPIGLLQNSRSNTVLQPLNTINALRQLTINSEQTGIIKNVDGSIYECKGLNIRFNFKDSSSLSSVSIRDRLLAKYNEDREKAFADFQRNLVEIKLVKVNKDTKEIVGTYSYNGKDYKISYIASGTSWENRDEHTMNAYIDSQYPDRPMLLFAKSIESQSADGRELYDILSLPNFSYKENQKLDIDNIMNLINNVGKKLRTNLQSIIKYGRNDEFDKTITDIIDKNYLNLGRTIYEKKSPYQFRFEYKDGKLTMSLYNLDGEKFLELNSISADKNTSQQDIFNFVQGGIKNLIFEDAYQVRLTSESQNSDRKFSLVKIQVNDTKVRNKYDAAGRIDPRTEVDYQRRVFFTNLYNTGQFSQDATIEEVTVNETAQYEKSNTGNVVQDALENLKHFIKDSNRTDQKFPGSVGVTTFINGKKYNDDEIPVKDVVAMSLGTSIDKLVRVYFEKGRSIDGVKQWMQDNNLATWFGFGGFGNQDFINIVKQIEKIAKFFEDRDEIPVTQEHIFSGELVSKTGKRVKLTAIPDIITVDRNGKYHIYDMKSFKYVPNAMSKLAGFNNQTKLYKGMSKDADDISMTKWTQQLTLYKAMIEQSLGANCVASIGIIPITLDYSLPKGTTLGTHRINQIGDQVRDVKIPSGDKMIPLRLKSKDVNISDDFIPLTPIDDITTISSDSWEEAPTTKTLSEVAKEHKPKEDKVDELIPIEQELGNQHNITGNDFERLVGGEEIEDFDMFSAMNQMHCD